VCGPDGGKPEDVYQLKKSFPNMSVPACSKYKQSNKDQYLIECPDGLKSGCLTKFEENGSIMRTCAPIAIEDCKKANGINYCYCKKEGCNTPERRLSDPERTGKKAGDKTSLDRSEAGYVSPSVSRFSDIHMDDEDMVEGSGGWGDFYYDDYNYGHYDQDYSEDKDADRHGIAATHRTDFYGSYTDDTEPDGDGVHDYSDVTNPPPFIDLENHKHKKGPHHKFDRDRIRERPNDIIIVEDFETNKPRKTSGSTLNECNPFLLVMLLSVLSFKQIWL